MISKEEFGKIIRHQRAMNRLTQKELADKCGFSRNTIVNIENGRQNVCLDQAFVFAKVLGFSLDYLVKEKRGYENE